LSGVVEEEEEEEEGFGGGEERRGGGGVNKEWWGGEKQRIGGKWAGDSCNVWAHFTFETSWKLKALLVCGWVKCDLYFTLIIGLKKYN